MRSPGDEDDLLAEFGLDGAPSFRPSGPGELPPASSPPPPPPPPGLSTASPSPPVETNPAKISEILNEIVQRNEAFKKRLGQQRPAVPAAASRVTKWQIGLGPVEIQPGATVSVSATPACLFRIERFMASETVPGATVVSGLFIGNDNRFPIGGGELATSFLSPTSLGSGIDFGRACQAGLAITVNVKNIGTVPATWTGALFGSAVR